MVEASNVGVKVGMVGRGVTVMVGVEDECGEGVDVLETEAAVGWAGGGVPAQAVRKKSPLRSPSIIRFMAFPPVNQILC